jgi:hypothetical protein
MDRMKGACSMDHEERLAELAREIARQDEEWERARAGLMALGEREVAVPVAEVEGLLERLGECRVARMCGAILPLFRF